MHWSNYFFYLQKIGTRYFMVAGLAFVLFYFLIKNRISYKKIQQKFPRLKDYAREIGYSILTICIFALVPLTILHVKAVRVHTFFYTDIHQYGWVYFFLAFPLMFIIHDTYFYWTHRLMHHQKIIQMVSPGSSSIYQSFSMGCLFFSPPGSNCGSRNFCRISFYHSNKPFASCHFLFCHDRV